MPQTNKNAQEEKAKCGKNVFREMFIKEKKKVLELTKELETLQKETKNKKSDNDKCLIEKNRKMNEKLNDLQTRMQKLQQQCKNSELQSKQREEQLQSQMIKLSANATSFKDATIQLQEKLEKADKTILGGAQEALFISRLEKKAKDIEKRENEVKNKEEIVNTQMEKIREYPNMQRLIASLKTKLREAECKTAEVKNRSLEEQIRDLNWKLENQAVREKEQDDHVKRLQTDIFSLERERDRIGRILEAYEEALLNVSQGNTSDYVQRFLAELRAKEDSIATYHTKVEELEQKIADLENTIEEASKSRTEFENAYSAIFGYTIHRVQGNLFQLININARTPQACFNFELKEDGQVTFSHSTVVRKVLDEQIWKCCSFAVFLAIFNESYLRDPDQELL